MGGVFDGDDGVEAFADASDAAFFSEAFQGFADGCGGSEQRGLDFRAIKAVKAMPLEVIEKVGNPLIVVDDVLKYAKKDEFCPFFNFIAHICEAAFEGRGVFRLWHGLAMDQESKFPKTAKRRMEGLASVSMVSVIQVL